MKCGQTSWLGLIESEQKFPNWMYRIPISFPIEIIYDCSRYIKYQISMNENSISSLSQIQPNKCFVLGSSTGVTEFCLSAREIRISGINSGFMIIMEQIVTYSNNLYFEKITWITSTIQKLLDNKYLRSFSKFFKRQGRLIFSIFS